MTIKDVKEEYKNEYAELEVYKAMSGGKYYPSNFHMDNCRSLGEDSPHGNCDIYADFEDWYGNKNAKVLCIMIK